MGKKATKLETNERIQTLHRLHREGFGRLDMLRYAADNWGLKERAVDYLRTKLFETIKREYQVSREQKTVETLDRLDSVYKASMRNNQYSNAIGAINAQARLLRLEPSN